MADAPREGLAGEGEAGPRRATALARLARAVVRWDVIVCAVVLACMSLALLDTIRRKSITVDEYVMIPSAYYHVAEGEFRLIHEHPPLSKFLAAAPLLFFKSIQTIKPGEAAPPAPGEANSVYWGHFWDRNRRHYRAVTYWSRVPLVALTAALGALLFAFARSLFGPLAAVCAVLLFAVEPTVLAHGRVVQTDVPAAFGCLLVVHALRRYLRGRTWAGAVFVGAAGAVAALAKFSMLLVGPVYAVVFLALIWRAPRAGRTRLGVSGHAAAAALALTLLIWAAYFFYSRPLDVTDRAWMAESFGGRAASIEAGVRALSYLFPTDFVLGVIYQLWHARVGHQAALLGMYSTHGWWYYFPVAFALKTTLPFLLLSLASLAWGVYRLARGRDKRFLYLLVPFGLYTLYVMASPINIGVRYYLPAYAFLFAGAGALVSRLVEGRGGGLAARAGLGAAAALTLWAGAEAARAFPHYMSYTNQLASARPHWWYLSDSNVEWGDDSRELALYLRRQGEQKVLGAFFTGWITMGFYGVQYVDALAPPGTEMPPTRYTAVGASFLNGSTVPAPIIDGRIATDDERVNRFAAYRDRVPEKVFGDSIYLFREDR